MLNIINTSSPDEVEEVRILFKEYAAWLNIDLCFQGYERELESLPGAYQPPGGRLLLAYYKDKTAGCIALRQFKGEICEMKRLFVRSIYRGLGIGKALAKKVIAEAKKIGYSEMRLDTLPIMNEAQALYTSLGFKKMEAYRHNPNRRSTLHAALSKNRMNNLPNTSVSPLSKLVK